ncbi:MAG: hypothetical protein Q9184_003091 [Pyrenodesmia sp. 2 TL-2023]
MHYLYPFTFALSIMIAAKAEQEASCWKSEPTTSHDNIKDIVPTVCNYLSGASYVKGETHYQCILDKGAVKWDFAITYVGEDASRGINADECMNGMNKQVACTYGGETTYLNWRYRSNLRLLITGKVAC